MHCLFSRSLYYYIVSRHLQLPIACRKYFARQYVEKRREKENLWKNYALLEHTRNLFDQCWTRPSRSTIPLLGTLRGLLPFLSLFSRLPSSFAQSHRSWYLCGSFFRSRWSYLRLTGSVLPQDRCFLGPVVARSFADHTVEKRCYIPSLHASLFALLNLIVLIYFID